MPSPPQNVIAPSGTIKLDRFEYQVETNSAPSLLDALNNLPIKAVNGAVVYIRDVAHVRDGNPPQTNIVRVDGTPRHHDEHHEDRLGFHAGHHQERARQPCQPQSQGPAAAATEDRRSLRSVDLRPRRHQRRGPRGHHRRLPHRHHDPGLPGQLALHASSSRSPFRSPFSARSSCSPCCTRPSTS